MAGEPPVTDAPPLVMEPPDEATSFCVMVVPEHATSTHATAETRRSRERMARPPNIRTDRTTRANSNTMSRFARRRDLKRFKRTSPDSFGYDVGSRRTHGFRKRRKKNSAGEQRQTRIGDTAQSLQGLQSSEHLRSASTLDVKLRKSFEAHANRYPTRSLRARA